MTTVTKEAEEHEPLGDPTHVGYGKNYGWECTCGKSSAFSTDMHTAQSRGAEHEEYCVADGKVTIVLLTPL